MQIQYLQLDSIMYPGLIGRGFSAESSQKPVETKENDIQNFLGFLSCVNDTCMHTQDAQKRFPNWRCHFGKMQVIQF